MLDSDNSLESQTGSQISVDCVESERLSADLVKKVFGPLKHQQCLVLIGFCSAWICWELCTAEITEICYMYVHTHRRRSCT